MLKKLILFGLIAFSGIGLQAQNSQKAKTLLNQVSAKVQSYNNMVIHFSYILENGGKDIQQKTNGNVTLKGNKYKLNLMGTTRIFDGEKLYDIIPEDEEINISTYDPKGDHILSPSRMFDFYKHGYSYQWDITQNVNGRKIQYVKLIPKDSDSDVEKILLGIDVHTKNIYKLIQILKDQSEIIINIKSFKTDQPLSKNLFKFNKDKYQGYYINRLD